MQSQAKKNAARQRSPAPVMLGPPRPLRAYDSVGEARASIGRYLDFYNSRRPHSSLDGSTPDQAYFNPLPSARQPNPGRGST